MKEGVLEKSDETETIELMFGLVKANLFRTPKVRISDFDNLAIAVEVMDPSSNPDEEEIMIEE